MKSKNIAALTILCMITTFVVAPQAQKQAIAITKLPATTNFNMLVEEDSTVLLFEEYKTNSQLYLDRDCFTGTPISGTLLSLCAKITYESTGVLVPYELALSQAQWESGMGRKGKSAKFNPYNVGEFDHGTVITFKSTKQGVQAYYNLIALNYLNEKSIDDLLSNFVNNNGHRYASSPTYENHIRGQFTYIQNWIENNSVDSSYITG